MVTVKRLIPRESLPHFAIELMDDEPIDRSLVSEKATVKGTPVKANGKPKPAQNTTNNPVASKSTNNPLIKIASKLKNLMRRFLELPVVFAERLQLREKPREEARNFEQHDAVREFLVDPEKNLVNVKSHPGAEQRLPSLSTGTSVDSHSSLLPAIAALVDAEDECLTRPGTFRIGTAVLDHREKALVHQPSILKPTRTMGKQSSRILEVVPLN
jgi:hypothetical protein